MAQRKAVDVIRAAARQAAPSAVPHEEIIADAADGSLQEQFADDTAQIWHDVARLPERQRLALAYHYLGGLPHTETAQIIGGSPAAVRRAAADGLASLRRTYLAGMSAPPDQTQKIPRQKGEAR